MGWAAPVSLNVTMSPLVNAQGVATLSQFKLPIVSQLAPAPLQVRVSEAESETIRSISPAVAALKVAAKGETPLSAILPADPAPPVRAPVYVIKRYTPFVSGVVWLN